MRRFLLILAGWTALAGAQEVRRAVPATPGVSADETAKFLAGVPLPEHSRLAPLQNTTAYAAHVRALAAMSRHYDQQYYSKMRAWSAAELAPRLAMNRPVYYFFGGPDAVSALALFPDAPVYILGGLESVGAVADPSTLPPEAVDAGLANLRQAVKVVLSYGHFITKDMKAELDRTDFRGVLPLLLTFVSLTGGEVVSVEMTSIGRDGVRIPSGETPGGLPGVTVVFRRAAGAAEQTIHYVQANVADDALRANGAALAWAGGFGQGNVYLKAASYLMHEAYFSRIRAFLLGKAEAVLQDDSGIPLRFFRDGNWRVWLFGRYTGTLDIFKQYHQGDLRDVYAAPGAAVELPFGTGYKWRVGESNLLLAVRQRVPRAESVR